MSKKLDLAITVYEDEEISVSFPKKDLQLVQYLATKPRLEKLEASLLSMLLYPAVWIVEDVVWKHRHKNGDMENGVDGSTETFEQITQEIDACFQFSTMAVKDALLNQARAIHSFSITNIDIEEHKYILADSSGNIDGGTIVTEAQWAIIIKICTELRNPKDHQLEILSALVCDIVFATEKAIRNKFFKGEEAIYCKEMGIDEMLERDRAILSIARTHALHCME